jgi:hypothetical protein
LVKADPYNIESEPWDFWGWFKRTEISQDIYALESQRYPGYFLDAYGDNGSHASLRLVKDDP